MKQAMHTARAASGLVSNMPHNVPSTMSVFFHLIIVFDGVWRPFGEVEAVPLILVVIH